jgi:spermidine/putrescine transport system substrate-binding protein
MPQASSSQGASAARPQPGAPGAVPAVIRGLTQPRLSRRDLFRHLGTGAGMLGLSAVLEACGVKGTARRADGARLAGSGAGSPAWWQKQQLHHELSFANWPLYIDTINGQHPTLRHFTQQTGIQVSYSEPETDPMPFYAKLRPLLQTGQPTGYDIIVITNISPVWRFLKSNGWLIPLDHTMMTNFSKYASPLVKNPASDPGNRYGMAWQSGWTAVGYNSSVIPDPGDSINILFDKKYAGRVGMMSDPQDLGSAGLLALGIEPATSTYDDWKKAATLLRRQKSDGIVRGYYDDSYIRYLKDGDTVVSQAWSGDVFFANLNSKDRAFKLLMPSEGAMFWTDNMCIPVHASNPKDAMTLMDFYYQPQVQAVLGYYLDYVGPVPGARDVLAHPAGWAESALGELHKAIGLPPSLTANALTVFPSQDYLRVSRNYYQFKSQEEFNAWNALFLPIIQGS